MKLELMFLIAVLGVAVIHLVFRLVNYLVSLKRPVVQESRQENQREDWYVFFAPAALYGDMDNSAVPTKDASEEPDELATTCEGSCLPLEAQA